MNGYSSRKALSDYRLRQEFDAERKNQSWAQVALLWAVVAVVLAFTGIV